MKKKTQKRVRCIQTLQLVVASIALVTNQTKSTRNFENITCTIQPPEVGNSW